MRNQFEDMLITTLVEKLKSYDIQLNPETVKKAVANAPQIVAQIETILLASSSEERLEKIKALITQAAKGEYATTEKTETTEK